MQNFGTTNPYNEGVRWFLKKNNTHLLINQKQAFSLYTVNIAVCYYQHRYQILVCAPQAAKSYTFNNFQAIWVSFFFFSINLCLGLRYEAAKLVA